MCDNSKEKFLLYKGSLKTESNIVSGILTDELWEKASFTLQDSLKASPEILSARSASNASSWKSSLSKLGDPLELFEQSISCPKCINTDTEYNGFFDFLKSSCKCKIPAMNYNKTDITIDNKQNNLFVKNLSSDNFSQESNSGGEQKSVFRTKTGKPNNLFPNSHLEFQKDSERSMLHEIQKPKTFDLDGKENLPEDEEKAHKSNVAKITFKTAKEQLLASNPAARRTLGASRKAQAKFVSPMLGTTGDNKQETAQTSEITDERLKNIDPKMIELIESEIIDKGAPVGWNDIAGLEMAKSVIQEAVVWPILRPDIFTGLRRPPKGILLFGPPGTGKTLIGKCIASQCNATFFSISASSLTSKWMGDGEKMVRALFAVARCQQPAVVFIDEIDSLLTQRSDSEHEASRRIKTEFLVQLDGAATGEDDRILIVGATNRPQELDEAARRRLVKRLYVPLPEIEAREQIICNLLQQTRHELSAPAIREVAALTAGYSGADMRSLCCEAAMGPVRALPITSLATIDSDMVRPVCAQDFKNALQRVRPSVSQDDLGVYVKWNKTYGQGF